MNESQKTEVSEKCSGQVKLIAVLYEFQLITSVCVGGKPPLCLCGLTWLEIDMKTMHSFK